MNILFIIMTFTSLIYILASIFEPQLIGTSIPLNIGIALLLGFTLGTTFRDNTQEVKE